ncbi:EF-P lysine aminoacylase EpmA [Asaia krungthepensis]|uniref:Lysyl-tRNA synthetase n=1 Tax=Asaia krungthepensis NRIC 0535 TaxID=1307925 RepID=A0ABQ0PW25_9PROT|nr:EF-P lysine aminoacylase EpmA [Asaia krungthepensis]GBQ83053.1 lysyl-tRNA synthetase [Asaia krungthepensis NRIC 0535]
MALRNAVSDKLPLMQRRTLLQRSVRAFFEARGYLEVETPYAVASPGEEVHLRCFRTELEAPDGTRMNRFLHTSPEFAMKRIVAATGLPVFQLARVWRNGEQSALHAAEFTMLEWYRPGAGLASLMDETEALLQSLLPPEVTYGRTTLRIDLPFERLTMAEAFTRYVGVDLLDIGEDAPRLANEAGTTLRAGENWEDLFFRLLLERIEPRIGRDRPTFLTHWPVAQAALSRRDPEDPRVALRFELYGAGVELANAFEELTDPAEQRARFEVDRARRLALAPDQDWPLDEAFLRDLEGLPPCSGIALGFDRLVMLATGAPRLCDIMWFS